MPTFKKRKSSKSLFSEDELKQPLAGIRSGVLSILKAALKCNVNRFTLQRYNKKFGYRVEKQSMITNQVSKLP